MREKEHEAIRRRVHVSFPVDAPLSSLMSWKKTQKWKDCQVNDILHCEAWKRNQKETGNSYASLILNNFPSSTGCIETQWLCSLCNVLKHLLNKKLLSLKTILSKAKRTPDSFEPDGHTRLEFTFTYTWKQHWFSEGNVWGSASRKNGQVEERRRSQNTGHDKG